MAITEVAPADDSRLTEVLRRRVKGLLAERDMDRQDLGPILGVSGSSASKRLRGDMPFGLDEVGILAREFGESVEYLLGLTDQRATPTGRELTPAGTVVDLASYRQNRPSRGARGRLPHQPRPAASRPAQQPLWPVRSVGVPA